MRAPLLLHKEVVSVEGFNGSVETSTMFRGNQPLSDTSPYDQFIDNTKAINRIYLGQAVTGENTLQSTLEPELAALVVLGYMSAVESYIRALVRRLIEVDDMVHTLVEPMTVSFGAARHHSRQLLPEALTEHVSFAGSSGLTTFSTMVGIQNFPQDMQKIRGDFLKICEIRHCCVHRFGRLGSKTAFALGTAAHKDLLEKPFHPSIDELQTISAALLHFVQKLNNFLYQTLLERIPVQEAALENSKYTWYWENMWAKDKKKFTAYYNIFSTQTGAGSSRPAKEVYQTFQHYLTSKKNPRSGNQQGGRRRSSGAEQNQAQ
ncbi:hypothetical protein [Agrobacterium larrymoorei]|uniref:hypothetical protein n=1 Tax=Agrobacterium larrymoorei TaxID=160699 RepID=UPI0030BF5FEC